MNKNTKLILVCLIVSMISIGFYFAPFLAFHNYEKGFSNHSNETHLI